jgi:hypothetical protein
MMDAHLADQGEVNHLYSSLFDASFYIPSFLTDPSDDDDEDISSMVSQYLCRRLMSRGIARLQAYKAYRRKEAYQAEQNSSDECLTARLYRRWHGNDRDGWLEVVDDEYACWNLAGYLGFLRDIEKGNQYAETWEKLTAFLLDFVYFLAYRSAGNPKKLALQFEQFARPLDTLHFAKEARGAEVAPPLTHHTRFVLDFDTRQQYQVQLISHVFIMLHGETSHMIRQYGDKLALATFSILDYLFKFHSTAFSPLDLERMPDLLDINRAPALPQVIDTLLGKMLTPYLRRVRNGVFEYRFLRSFQQEVVYISQFSEQDLAAFNFTLDESINIKQHYRDLLKRQMRYQLGHKEGIQTEKGADNLALPSVHVVLGDIHALDRAFTEALTEYRNALQYLLPSIRQFDLPVNLLDEAVDVGKPVEDQERRAYPISSSFMGVVLYVRILLKMGLMSEQRNEYDAAVSLYFQAYRVVEHLMKRRFRRFLVPNLEQLNTLSQAYLCLGFLHAKRDALPDIAQQFMDRAYTKLADHFDAPSSLDAPESKKSQQVSAGLSAGTEIHSGHIWPGKTERALFLSELLLRSAEINSIRSRFLAAASKYIDVIKSLAGLAIVKDSLDPCRDPDVLRTLGFALSGLGDACCAEVVNRYYINVVSEFDDNIAGSNGASLYWLPLPVTVKLELPHMPGESEYRVILQEQYPKKKLVENINGLLKNLPKLGSHEELSNCLGSPNRKKRACMKRIYAWMSKNALRFHLLSAIAYRLANMPEESALSLWKIQHLFAYVLSFPELLEGGIHLEGKEQKKALDDWLFCIDSTGDESKKNLVETFSMYAFEASYRIHRRRLEELYGIKEGEVNIQPNTKDLLRWIVPPLSQSARVLKKFWWSWQSWQGEGSVLNKERLGLERMGAFPLEARILACLLKARTYLREYEPVLLRRHERGEEYQTSEEIEMYKQLRIAFQLLVNCVEDGTAYEGGLPLLNPQLGVVYYFLWRLAYHCGEDPAFDKTEFQGEKARFLDERYCRTKALQVLRNMIERHTGGQAYFDHVNRQYFLHDAFSDRYTQGLWAGDYALMPIARWMERHIQQTVIDEEQGVGQ